MEKENNTLLLVLVGLVVLLLVSGFAFGVALNNKAKLNSEKVDSLEVQLGEEYDGVTYDEVKDIVDTAIASIPQDTAIAPEASESDKVDRLCELTDGCLNYLISGTDKDDAVAKVSVKVPSSKDFKRTFADLSGIDKDYLYIKSVDLKDSNVFAVTKKDKEKENLNVQLFYKVVYKDEDEKDTSTMYILVTSVLDEGDYDDLSIEEVERTFEFD